MADEIIELLKNSKLREKIVKMIADTYSYALTLEANPPDDTSPEYLNENGCMEWSEAWWQAEIYADSNIEKTFQEYIFDKIQKPYRVTLAEISGAFSVLSYIDPREFGEGFDPDDFDFDALYTVFVNHVDKYLLQRRISVPFPVCTIPSDEKEAKAFARGAWMGMQKTLQIYDPDQASQIQDDFEDENREKDLILWEKNGIRLRWTDYEGRVEGRISESVLEQIATQMRVLMPSVIWHISLLEPSDDEKHIHRWHMGLPEVDGKILKQKSQIRRFIDAYYSEPTKKDTFNHRIRNAVQLLVESDNQSTNAVGLALSVTAIDALLGENTTEMTEKLAENVAVLMEPELDGRSNAKEFVKKMYNNRSRILHGDEIDSENNIRSDARLLAAGVLMAVVSYTDFFARSGLNPKTPQELLKELRDLLFKKGQPVGVNDFSNVRKLWNKSA